MTPTTFTLTYEGRTYQRCLSELRPYRATGMPDLDAGVAPDSATSFEQGSLIAYRDTDDNNDDDSSRFHLGLVTNIADGIAHVHCHGTTGKALSRAKWKPLHQNTKGVFGLGDSGHGEAVMDQIPVDEPEWVLHYNVQLKDSSCLTKRTRRQLEDMGVTHHRLGHTY